MQEQRGRPAPGDLLANVDPVARVDLQELVDLQAPEDRQELEDLQAQADLQEAVDLQAQEDLRVSEETKICLICSRETKTTKVIDQFHTCGRS